ncbi:Holliday junction resolvase RuvX [Pediococcus claussenii]|uniref:Putative pre-16S rRNA nuclease n=1 Tax=Pediococcus claussenii (strain ATCC BAA-344 / DSM 14800 / JCM 18046 / KCTC 3811 / LMG 21948 / P06) TaxID=701521 RepID=G8PCN1_PEDCP|nr:Holliday junction resolvase RuvX [Pediococcus claussenii]AEV95016.1 putative Holliday junction resolvase [Pediococcus claussenii ATCC BAA-344]ANZ70205.1 crossover junction endodeoxyribonuclease RuvA [Pediococcus claussenii]ANZ72021.1 crossover junction endodeoxyribonuclease RuvA [Pediococcus claussenii]KRN19182.1 yrrK protein [Pediococcus claussenii]
MRLMGLDVGSRTVGIAVSDQLGWTAQGVEIIRINEDEQKFGIERLKELVNQYEVAGFVIGLPKNMNNSEGPRAEAARDYGKLVTDTFGLPIDFQDERLTTVEAERMLVEQADTSRSKRKKVIDKLAASLILENYLGRQGKLLTQLK